MNVLVPVDGSPASLRAVDFAVKMASQTPGTSLVLLNVQNISAIAAPASRRQLHNRLPRPSGERWRNRKRPAQSLRPSSEMDRRQK